MNAAPHNPQVNSLADEGRKILNENLRYMVVDHWTKKAGRDRIFGEGL